MVAVYHSRCNKMWINTQSYLSYVTFKGNIENGHIRQVVTKYRFN